MILANYDTAALSAKMKWLSFLATWAVVIYHSPCGTWEYAELSVWAFPLQVKVSKCLTWPVPYFFVVSGYFLWKSYEKYGYVNLLKNKIRSLYIPLVLWSYIATMLILPSAFYVKDYPDVTTVLVSPLLGITDFNAWGKTSLLGVFHFWYIRDLLLCVIAMPVLYWVTKRLGWLFVCGMFLVLGCLMTYGVCGMWIGPYHFRSFWKAGFFVPLGLVLAKKNLLSVYFSKRLSVFVISLCFVLLISILMSPLGEIGGSEIVLNLLQVCILWFSFDLIADRIPCPSQFLNGMFFVYCLHLVLLRYIGGGGRVLLRQSEWSIFVIFFLNCLSFWGDVLIMCFFRNHCPTVYRVLSRGR